MAEQLSIRHGEGGQILRRGDVQVVFPANPDRKGGFIYNEDSNPFRVRLDQGDATDLAPGKVIQFGAEPGEICVVGEYMQRFRAMEFY